MSIKKRFLLFPLAFILFGFILSPLPSWAEDVTTSYDYYMPGFVMDDSLWLGLALSNENTTEDASVRVVVYGQTGDELEVADKLLLVPCNI